MIFLWLYAYGSSTFAFNIGGGGVWDAGGNWFSGKMDDVRVYDRALTQAEIGPLALRYEATNPDPADGSAARPDVSGANLYMVLDYTPGPTAISHAGYFSDNYDDVSNRVAGANLSAPPYTDYGMPRQYYVGFNDPANIPAFACVSLVRGKTYYWAIDESDGAATYPGDVWSFTVMPQKAWDPNPVDGARYVMADPDVALSWRLGDVDMSSKTVTYDVYYGTVFADVNESTTRNENVDTTNTTIGGRF